MAEIIYASILHGAYGDYYEQALCLKHFRLTHPNARMKLFAASPHRLAELQVLDFSWADSFQLWTTIEEEPVDEFLQFQVFDKELQTEVLSRLSPKVRTKLNLAKNLLPWLYLRPLLPLSLKHQMELSQEGARALSEVMQANSIDSTLFTRPTVGFLWRYRAPGGAVSATFQSSAESLVAKYSKIFRRMIDDYGCHVLVCGMKVQTTAENRFRIDAKFPTFGLDLPSSSSTHLKGLSWALELEILSRCNVCVVHPSGFSEALWLKRPSHVVLVDPPVHYLTKTLWRRMPLFGLTRPISLVSALASRSGSVTFQMVRRELEKSHPSVTQH